MPDASSQMPEALGVAKNLKLCHNLIYIKNQVCDSIYIAVADLFLLYILFCGMGRATFLTRLVVFAERARGAFLAVVLFGYLITVSLLQLNLTIQRRSQAHVEYHPPTPDGVGQPVTI